MSLNHNENNYLIPMIIEESMAEAMSPYAGVFM